MGKFALRGLAQSLAREFGPKNIHVAHFVIDGGIERAGGDARAAARGQDGMLRPDAIAETYLAVYRQHRSAWAFEVDLRPWVETSDARGGDPPEIIERVLARRGRLHLYDRLDAKRAALVVIDMQNAFVAPGARSSPRCARHRPGDQSALRRSCAAAACRDLGAAP